MLRRHHGSRWIGAPGPSWGMWHAHPGTLGDSLQYPQDDGPGLLPTLTNPYAFATAQVRHVLRTYAWGALTREAFEDAVQDALLWAWERRHGAHMMDFPGSISAVIRGRLRRRKGRA